jgi:hypothetical protein
LVNQNLHAAAPSLHPQTKDLLECPRPNLNDAGPEARFWTAAFRGSHFVPPTSDTQNRI